MEPDSDCVEIWSVENNAKAVPVAEEEAGIFFTNRSYICLLSYIDSGRMF